MLPKKSSVINLELFWTQVFSVQHSWSYPRILSLAEKPIRGQTLLLIFVHGIGDREKKVLALTPDQVPAALPRIWSLE
jgi:hypothetical protein